MKAFLYLEDGSCLCGESFGASGETIGELVFNTCMTGYQEVLTDPSYAGQIVCMTYPLIGNYGIDPGVNESRKACLKAFIIKEAAPLHSNFTSRGGLEDFLKEQGVIALKNIDTRKLTRKIREIAGFKGIVSNRELLPEELDRRFEEYRLEKNLVELVSTAKIERIPGEGAHIAVIDYGSKRNIIRNLQARGCRLTVFPFSAAASEILEAGPDGIMLSNGPGDPADVPGAAGTVRILAEKKPLFGICLGHQILSLAFGAKTYKLKYGHHGGNHAIKDIQTGRCYITSQNHEYAVDPSSLAGTGLEVTMINLNDNTVEGIRHRKYPAFSVQFHPEACPGPRDANSLFDDFLETCSIRN
ncbi:MAG: glutamine-hydrolyzing carbamoyl-phosphate synthase small subunit [Oscillospiraceae bacterium]|jgi:carbamoyl-phosphate synthase small subunit|nr:glutamine-hydrolyzing carbamoyl-phosphate synthase small subunit [Oscillospiraceae bacterium]